VSCLPPSFRPQQFLLLGVAASTIAISPDKRASPQLAILQHPSAPSRFEKTSAPAAVSDTCTLEGYRPLPNPDRGLG
jgi:hypothetical protein